MSTSNKKPAAATHHKPFISQDSEAAFHHFAPLVVHIAEPERWNADADVVRANTDRGVDAVRPHRERIARALPLLDFDEILEMPALARAIGYADDRIIVPASKQEIAARQARLRPLRRLTLAQLEIFALLGLVPMERYKAIRANSGPLDEARDGVAIAGTFREYARAVENKHPFTAEQLATLAEDGNWLLGQLTPQNVAAAPTGPNPDAVVRDQLYTELLRRFDELLYKAGVEVFGRRKVDENVPPLLSRIVERAPAGGTPTGGGEGR